MTQDHKLWEVEHPYYCSPQSYTENGTDESFDSWREFFDEYGDSDFDMNLVFRFDWKSADPDDGRDTDVLEVFFMQQRRGRFVPVTIAVSRDDEPAARAWLRERYDHLKRLWTPFEAATAA
jgi:hypothetical protein